MRVLAVPCLVLAFATLVIGCGKSGGDAASAPPPASSSPSAAAGAAGGFVVPADLDQGPRAAESPGNDALVAQGEKLFQGKGCSACHGFGRRISCPDLDGVTQRRTTRWMETQILHPESMTKQDPIAHQLFAQFSLQMPNQGLKPDEAIAVIEFLKHKNHERAESH